MPDQATAVQPKVALIFGDAGAVQHLRDALAGQVEIVYDAQAALFDAARLVASGARSALVNLDSYDWLDTLTAQLGKTGVAVVFNDPETSVQLEGWEHARWLRHLVAKLRGSDDYDPPRPLFNVEHAVAPTAVAAVGEPVATSVSAPPAAATTEAAEKPLSPREIQSLTADFGTATAAPTEQHGEAPVLIAESPADPLPPPATAVSMATADSQPLDEVVATEPAHLITEASAADDFDPALDVDTEALSAMIDARLAEPESRVQPVIADDLSVAIPAEPTPAAPAKAESVAEPEPSVVAPAPPPPDDADILADLPALGDWALVDPEAPVAAAPKATQQAEPALTDSFAGIELVPMDNDVPLELHTEPVEHRLYVEGRKKTDAANDQATGSANGDHA